MRFFTFIILISSLLYLGSCDSKNQQTSDNITHPDSAESTTSNSIIIPNQSALLKSINLGDPVSKIKQIETFEIFEDSTNHVGYTFETENFETIDILYFLDANKNISQIKADIYLNNIEAVKSLWVQLENYWSGKYKTSQKTAKTITWHVNNNIILKVEDVTKNKDYGIKISIEPHSMSNLKQQIKPLE